ncbi:hypothetical protein E2986_12704 [Frieseomelitta varia]|uniref:Uncharacterized protein n=1 Tax=Frieseomelitta varia TaxID=561572 RepID=A0A833RV74_9HYME|nr:hypothetical protein E2986_12704 [Frieseomelitta varia]
MDKLDTSVKRDENFLTTANIMRALCAPYHASLASRVSRRLMFDRSDNENDVKIGTARDAFRNECFAKIPQNASAECTLSTAIRASIMTRVGERCPFRTPFRVESSGASHETCSDCEDSAVHRMSCGGLLGTEDISKVSPRGQRDLTGERNEYAKLENRTDDTDDRNLSLRDKGQTSRNFNHADDDDYESAAAEWNSPSKKIAVRCAGVASRLERRGSILTINQITSVGFVLDDVLRDRAVAVLAGRPADIDVTTSFVDHVKIPREVRWLFAVAKQTSLDRYGANTKGTEEEVLEERCLGNGEIFNPINVREIARLLWTTTKDPENINIPGKFKGVERTECHNTVALKGETVSERHLKNRQSVLYGDELLVRPVGWAVSRSTLPRTINSAVQRTSATELRATQV